VANPFSEMTDTPTEEEKGEMRTHANGGTPEKVQAK
jgi:hypothetical protein